MRVDLLLGEPGPGRRLARRVADLRGEVADDQHGDVAEVLEQAQPAQHDREPEVDVGGGRVDAELHAQRRAALELLAQLGLGDDVDRARGQQLAAGGRRPRPGTVTNRVGRARGDAQPNLR